MSTTLNKKDWGPPLFDADWYSFCQPLYRGIEGEDLEDSHFSYKEMSSAVGKEATGSPESKSPLENEGSQRRRRRIRPYA